jgi:CRISPR-associated protein Cas2
MINNKKRRLVSDILEGYGTRVNKSVFECILKNKKQKQDIVEELKATFDPKTDSIRIYTICQKCLTNSDELGKHPDPFDGDSIFWI